jgi:hypothetical protein
MAKTRSTGTHVDEPNDEVAARVRGWNERPAEPR